MAYRQPERSAVPRETINQFMERRGREVASFGRAAEAAAYAGVKSAIRAGQDYRLMTPSEVMAYGGSLVRGRQAQAAPVSRRSAPETAKRSRLDDSLAAKAVGGAVAHAAGLAPGVARGVVHSAKGAVDGAVFVLRLANPLDEVLSKPGQSAWDQVDKLGRSAVDYTVKAVQDPSMVRRDIGSAARAFRVDHDPTATPVADTFVGELKRGFNLGMNNGELAFDAGSLLVGGAAIRGAAGLGRAAKAAAPMERAFLDANPGFAARLELPYSTTGMSHHIVNRGAKLPKLLGGGPYPGWFIESEFNKIRHDPGISTRDMRRNHVGAGGPRHYGGGAIGREFGGGSWRASELGWDKYGPLDRLNYGTSPATKAIVGPVLVGGAASDFVPDEAP